MEDLAPEIPRQRLVIEGIPDRPIAADAIEDYLSRLSIGTADDGAHSTGHSRSPKFGWAGWIHWETSGAHFYAWETPRLFFSVDIYTCKAFSVAGRGRRSPRTSSTPNSRQRLILTGGTASANAAGTKLHADTGADRPGRLGHRVLPRSLATAAHHQQIAVPDLVAT